MFFLPCDHDDEVHDVPHVSEVASRVKDKALGKDLQAGLNGENAQEVGLRRFLKQLEPINEGVKSGTSSDMDKQLPI